MTDYFFEIALSKLSSVGPVTARLLVSYCGCAEGVFKEKRTRLEKIPGIGQYTLSQISLETVTEETEKNSHLSMLMISVFCTIWRINTQAD